MVMRLEVVERQRILWRARGSWGPDVEMVLPLPVTVAVEAKNTVGDALGDLDQLIGYARNRAYDAMILRILHPGGREDDLEKLLRAVRGYGIGVVAGGDAYSPLMGNERVLLKACLRLTSEPAEVNRGMGLAARALEMPLSMLIEMRKFFEVC
jgi:hypothetical protein